MLFNSLQFAYFFAIVLVLYGLLPTRAQNLLLLAASLWFYAAWDWRFLPVLLFTIALDFSCALEMERSVSELRRRAMLLLSLTANLGLLVFFKYSAFIAVNLCALGGIASGSCAFWPELLLPLGISFYTFQSISYSIDVYRRDVPATRGFVEFALAVSFFPHLLAGPIQRASNLIPQVKNPRARSWQKAQEGVFLFFWGLVQKMVIADNLAQFVDPVFDAPVPSASLILLATYAFAFQILCDFAGYSNMARGAAKLLGFELMVNFRAPYLSSNPKEFWRRWHISLSSWFRDYLYVPLGGNRTGWPWTYRNLLITMLLAGLWHGANWTFVLWGIYHGLLLIGYDIVSRIWRGQAWARLRKLCGSVLLFHLVCFGWLLFRAESMAQFVELVSGLVNGSWVDPGALRILLAIAALVALELIVEIWVCAKGAEDELAVWLLPLPARIILYYVGIYGLLIFGVAGAQPFIYFQF